ncbi:MAG TPA: hypothetical protein VIT68_00825 [Candidatus Gracilibacteria bacterium]
MSTAEATVLDLEPYSPDLTAAQVQEALNQFEDNSLDQESSEVGVMASAIHTLGSPTHKNRVDEATRGRLFAQLMGLIKARVKTTTE